MAKKIKKNTNRGKKTDTDINKTTIDKKKQQKQKKNDTNKVAIIKDQNAQFKSKLKKNKYQLAKKFKQIQSNQKKHTFADFLDHNSVKLLNTRNKDKKIKTDPKIEDKRQRKKQKNSKRHIQKEEKKEQRKEMRQKEIKQKQHKIKVKNSNQSNSKTNSNEQHLNKKQPKSIKSERNKKQMNNNKIKVDLALCKTKAQKNTPKKHKLDIKKLKKLITTKPEEIKVNSKVKVKVKSKSKITKLPSLRERMMTKLKASRFRYLNETLYNSESSESKNYFKNDPESFKAYHEGYKQQVEQWPLNPLDVIIASIKKMPKEHIVADFGCGEAKLAVSVPHKVHSFDFISLNENVTVCDVAHTPLLTSGVNVVVFCLSLMGTNLKDYIIEANRVLKKDGILKIAEVESRFDKIEDFIKTLSSYGFKNTWKDLSHNLFYFLDFKKERDLGSKRNKLPPIILKSCLYKKR